MRKLIASVLIFLTCLLPLQTCAKQPVASKHVGVITSSLPDVDFGTIKLGETKMAIFTLNNDGDAPAILKSFKVETDSEEFSVAVPATPYLLKEGSTTVIAITYKPISAGKDTMTITVETSSPKTPKVTINVKGNVIDPMLDET